MAYQEGQWLQGSDGNTYQVRNGVPVLVDASSAQGSTVVAPANPLKVREATAGIGKTVAETGVTTATAPAVIAKAGADATKATQDTRLNGLGAAEYNKALAQFNAARSLDATIAELAAKYRAGPGSTKGLAGIMDYFPTPANQGFNTAANSARGIVRNALGLTGGEANTAAEANMNLGAYIPQSGSFDSTIEDSITRLGRLRDTARSQAMQTLGGIPDANGRITPVQAPNAMQQPYVVNEAPQAAGVGATATRDPIPKEMQAEYNAYLSRNIGAIDPQDYVKFRLGLDAKYGFGADPGAWQTYLDEANRFNSAAQRGAKLNTTIPGPERKLSAVDQLRNNAVSNPLGAAAAGFADAGSFGGVSALAGDKLDALRNASTANALGMLGGEMAGAVGVTGLMRRAGKAVAERVAPSLLRPGAIPDLSRNLLADTAYSAAYGQNANGDPVTGAITGGAGSLLGQGIGKLAGAALGGVQVSPAVQKLRAMGVPLTLGRTLGGPARMIEDAMTSLPGAGDQVLARQLDTLRAYNQAGFNVAGAPINAEIGATGRQGIAALDAAKSQAYSNALDPVAINAADPAFAQSVGQVRQSAMAIPNVNGAQDAALAGLDHRIAGAIDPNSGMIPGRNFQEAYRGLARTGRERANGDYGHEVGQVMRQGQDALAGALEAQNPGAYQAFLKANAANRNLNVLADAVNAAKNQTDQLFTPAQLNTAVTSSNRKLGSNVSAAVGDSPLAQLADLGQGVIPSKLPDSGTARRLIQNGLVGGVALGGGAGAGYLSNGDDPLGGAGSGALKTLALLGALSLGGTKSAQKALANAFVMRPQALQSIGRAISKKAGVMGTAAVPLAIAGSR